MTMDTLGTTSNQMSLCDCSAIILAGGLSTRFGREKASAEWRGQSMLAHIASRLRPHIMEIIAVARPEQDTAGWPVDHVVSDDTFLPAGPLRGITAGLSACTNPYSFILSCDTPCIEAALLGSLRHCMNPGVFAVVPVWEGHLQPLLSLFTKKAGRFLEAFLRLGESSPTRALNALPYAVLSEKDCRSADPNGLSFININHREDLLVLERSLDSLDPTHAGLQPMKTEDLSNGTH